MWCGLVGLTEEDEDDAIASEEPAGSTVSHVPYIKRSPSLLAAHHLRLPEIETTTPPAGPLKMFSLNR